ncbi:Transcriptional regulator MntR [bioreactor metagenome]|uniref:Transcriptional regulator MntR n=1 Tax=bioreactor metagenome TaxID=1076179 RepID=A0A645AGH7_9ZZZZ
MQIGIPQILHHGCRRRFPKRKIRYRFAFHGIRVIFPSDKQNGASAMPAKLTESLEDYIEAIAELTAVEGHAHSKEIAARLQVKMPSVTGALRQLARMNYIVYNTHFPVALTPAGKTVADRVIRRHRVLRKFFSDILGLPVQQASETACKLEHIIDEETVERFVIFSEAIENRSDARQLQTYLTEAMNNLAAGHHGTLCVLSDLVPGESAEVARFGRNLRDPERLDLTVGTPITLESISLDKRFYHLAGGGETFDLILSDAENIWVKRIR